MVNCICIFLSKLSFVERFSGVVFLSCWSTGIVLNLVTFHRSSVTLMKSAYASQNVIVHSLFFVLCKRGDPIHVR